VRPYFGTAACALALAVAGCTGDSAAEVDTSPLNAAELGWVRGYSTWAIEVNDDDGASRARVTACEERLDRIGPAPSSRLELAASSARSVCPLLSERGMRRRALDAVEDADALILPLLRDEQALVLETGPTETSRADPRLSEVASDVVGDAVEVRCWSEDDWERVVTEENAWTDDSMSHTDLVGWSAQDVDRIHLVLDACNLISRAERGDFESWSRGVQIDVADAIETLAHEIRHFVLPDADEAEVECAAIRSLPAFARRFGVTSGVAETLTELYRTEVYPQLDEEYTRGGCPRA
jgi:hypothetical protein